MIQEKLMILKENNVITDVVYDYTQEVLLYLKDQNIVKTEDQADVFITHLAMATARQYTDENVNSVDPLIYDEIKANVRYEEAVHYWKNISALAPITFRENETGYFYLHLVALLNNE